MQQQPRRSLYRYEYPETGTEHILRSRADEQKTLTFPESNEFYANAVCGQARVHLKEGDLTEMTATLEADEALGICETCLEHSRVFVKDQ